MKNTGFAKMVFFFLGGGGGVKKVHYGKCGSGTLFWNTGMGAVTSSENALH